MGDSVSPVDAILIVEDEPGLLAGLTAFFEKRGYLVLQAANGKIGYEVLDRYVNERKGPPVSAIVSDWMMEGGTGLDLLQSVRGGPHAAIAFLLVSGQVTREELLDARKFGLDAVLIKPFTPAELMAKVREMIQAKSEREISAMLKTMKP